MCMTSCSGCPPAEKFPSRAFPESAPRERPRNFSAAGLTITARESRVNNSKPSSSPAITEFMFSRMVLKISCTPRSCCPTCVIFRLTTPSSSPLPANPLTSGEGASYSPAEMRSNCAEMSRNGASVAPLTTAASKVEITNATSTIVPDVRRLGSMSFNKNPEEQHHAHFSERLPSLSERIIEFVDLWRTCQHSDLMQEIPLHQL